MMNRKYCNRLRRTLSLALALVTLLSCMSVSAAALSLKLAPSGNVTNTTSSISMMEKQEAGIYWLGCYRDVYQALNLQFNRVTSGLVLDSMNFEKNELWILKPISSNSVYFTLAPLSHPDYYVAGQRNDCQLRLSKTSASNYAVQWMAIPDGNRYVLVNRQTGLAMDTANGLSNTGNKVLNYTRNGYQDAQSWSMIRISESTSTWYLGSKTTIADGAYGILSSGNLAKCINDQFASTAGNGSAKVCLDTWNKEAHETYIFTNRGNGRYTISPSNATNVCLNVWGSNPIAGNQITLATYQAGDECSLWEIYQSGSYYSFRNVKTGLWLNLWCNNHTDGQKIVGYYYDGTDAMKWKLQSVSSDSGTTVKLNVPNFKQYDSRWGSVKIGTKTIKSIGCLLTSSAMVYSYKNNTTVYPNAMKSKLSFSNNDLIWSSLTKYGFTRKTYSSVQMSNSMMATIYAQLKAGKPVIIGATGNNSHFIVVTGYTGTSTTNFNAANFTINDPNSTSRINLAQFLAVYPKVTNIIY